MKEVFRSIKSAFDALWHIKWRGEHTIEITTPIATTTDMFVSVFVTMRGADFVVTDGAWLCDGVYGVDSNAMHPYLRQVLKYYKEKYEIQETSAGYRTFYYKKTNSINLLPNIVFDVAHFIGAIASNSDISFATDRCEKTFKSEAKEFLSNVGYGDSLEFDRPITKELHNIRFNAVLKRENSVSLVNFVSGHNASIYSASLCRSNTDFSIIAEQSLQVNVGKRIILYDDRSKPTLRSTTVQQYLSHLQKKQTDDYRLIPWECRGKVEKLLGVA